jgi:hypothetical protein
VADGVSQDLSQGAPGAPGVSELFSFNIKYIANIWRRYPCRWGGHGKLRRPKWPSLSSSPSCRPGIEPGRRPASRRVLSGKGLSGEANGRLGDSRSGTFHTPAPPALRHAAPARGAGKNTILFRLSGSFLLRFDERRGHLEKLISLPIADCPGVNVYESEREQTGIIRRQSCGARSVAAIFRGARDCLDCCSRNRRGPRRKTGLLSLRVCRRDITNPETKVVRNLHILDARVSATASSPAATHASKKNRSASGRTGLCPASSVVLKS